MTVDELPIIRAGTYAAIGHSTVGHRFHAYHNNATYFCDSYEPRLGFWMTNERDPTDRRNVSERAIGRTFHRLRDHHDGN